MSGVLCFCLDVFRQAIGAGGHFRQEDRCCDLRLSEPSNLETVIFPLSSGIIGRITLGVMVGSRLGSYEIVGAFGVGGMEVYAEKVPPTFQR